ncbi:MAG: hypothetical protein CUN49_06455 [Candidatus Thermofonsia Clade 1 bacterium]|jgi:hypothetical protein|uniref:PI3K/PI4K catalytic domain-containing protein n=1 Tax=Candidatus Thermofonsia Clade 1 bacterium TaxID=2364210 RepID=A0A2M8PFB9_9CHLR|nr:MAG: hypothetical protein CUN49_06455 [Candidatus Thermofonsia Clade 1 bacterium]PJF42541.1 MAG: hypothetical protein CUN50_03650 [Candidatus Thermofonsia Clade 1 bacterium]RMF53228.1 MAG: hypothetical protein D6749_02835 [Chloroflexota bacterium]
MSEAEVNRVCRAQDVPRVLRWLSEGKMREANQLGLRTSSNSTFLVSLAPNTPDAPQALLAVYKPQRGERPLWDFPDGTLCRREYAAFLVSQALGWQIVPPTVLRDGLRGFGSVQLYIVHNPEVHYFTLDERFHDQLRKMVAFDYVINNADRKGGHCIVSEDGHLWGIDHGIGFHTAPKLRTVIWDFAGEPIPEELLTDLERLYCEVESPAEPLRYALSELLSEAEINALMARLRKLLQRREYPRPGPGLNYPWPPV